MARVGVTTNGFNSSGGGTNLPIARQVPEHLFVCPTVNQRNTGAVTNQKAGEIRPVKDHPGSHVMPWFTVQHHPTSSNQCNYYVMSTCWIMLALSESKNMDSVTSVSSAKKKRKRSPSMSQLHVLRSFPLPSSLKWIPSDQPLPSGQWFFVSNVDQGLPTSSTAHAYNKYDLLVLKSEQSRLDAASDYSSVTLDVP